MKQTKLGEEFYPPLSFVLGILLLLASILTLVLNSIVTTWLIETLIFLTLTYEALNGIVLVLGIIIILLGIQCLTPKRRATCPHCGFGRAQVGNKARSYRCKKCKSVSVRIADHLEAR